MLVAGIAAALTSYVTGGISSAVDAVQALFQEEEPPVVAVVGRAIQANRRANLGSSHWVFVRPIESLAYPRSGDLGDSAVWDSWARRNGGVEADSTGIEVVLQGASDDPVTLTALTVDVVRRAPPPKGIHVLPFGGGVLGARLFDVDLDATPPTVTATPGEFDGKPAIDFPYTVARKDPEVFYIVASTDKCDCSWRAVIHWVYSGRKGETVIDDGGRPFRTASSSRSTAFWARDGQFSRG